MTVSETFHHIARDTANAVGRPKSFFIAVAVIVVWAITGPLFHFSDTWQLIINTGTTIVTFLMVFLIQNTQNRDALAIHLKLDELIRSVKGARNSLLNLETLSDEELARLQEQFTALRERQKANDTKATVAERAGAVDDKVDARDVPADVSGGRV